METLSIILIVLLVIVVIFAAFNSTFGKKVKCPKATVASCYCALNISKDDIKSFFKTYSATPGFNLPLGLTTAQVNEFLDGPNVILPQNVHSLSQNAVVALTEVQLYILNLGILSLLARAGFSADQLKALTPPQISKLSAIQVLGAMNSVMNNLEQNPFTPDQLQALMQLS